MTEPPVLALPDFTKPFSIECDATSQKKKSKKKECDASGEGIGAVLMQGGRAIAFFNQALKGRALELPTYEKELLAVVLSVQKW